LRFYSGMPAYTTLVSFWAGPHIWAYPGAGIYTCLLLSTFPGRTRWHQPVFEIAGATPPPKADLKVRSVHVASKYRILQHSQRCQCGPVVSNGVLHALGYEFDSQMQIVLQKKMFIVQLATGDVPKERRVY
jgi:hypothetical protein